MVLKVIVHCGQGKTYAALIHHLGRRNLCASRSDLKGIGEVTVFGLRHHDAESALLLLRGRPRVTILLAFQDG